METARTTIELENEQLLHNLDKGIDDMLAGRELPLEQAFEKIRELRTSARNARTQNNRNQ